MGSSSPRRPVDRKRISKKGSVAIDTVPLPDKTIGMKIVRGKVTRSQGGYALTVGRRKVDIPLGVIIDDGDVRGLSGKEVLVAFSNRRRGEIVAIGTWPEPEHPRMKPKWVFCYIPAPDMMRRVDLTLRKTLVRKMKSEKIISSKMAREIMRGLE